MDNIIVSALRTHNATAIFLHGLGDTGAGWEPLWRQLRPKIPHIKAILPSAPSIPVSLNQGYVMPAWYDIRGLSPASREDEDGVKESVSMVHKLIDEEIRSGIPAERIIVGGFSQGCAVGLTAGFTYPKKLGGILGLSGYLPCASKFVMNPAARDTPCSMHHGDADMVVKHAWGKMSFQTLKDCGATNIKFTTYEGMGHSADDKELNDIVRWLNSVVPESSASSSASAGSS